MSESGYKGFKRRKGFTLVEVMLATVAGTSLLISMTYTSREIKRAVDTAYNEAMLQTLARDLNENLEKRMPLVLGEMAFSDESIAMPVDGADEDAALRSLLFARSPYAMGAMSVGLVDRTRWLSAPAGNGNGNGNGGGKNATPSPSPSVPPTNEESPSPSPSVSPIGEESPSPSPSIPPISEESPSPSPSIPPISEDDGEGAVVEAPEYIDEVADVMPAEEPELPVTENAENQTLQLGNFALRFEDGTRGGSIKFTKPDGTWWPMLDIGDRGLIQDSKFAFGGWTPPVDADAEALSYDMPQSTAKKLITMTTKLAKDDMLPFFLQSAWAPRNTWQWVKDTIENLGNPPSGWSEPPSAKNFPDPEGLFPAAVPKDMIATDGWDVGWAIDVMNGAGTGSHGWIAFPEAQNNNTLVEELNNPDDVEFYDPVLNATDIVDIGSTVQTLTGDHGNNWHDSIGEMVTDGKIVTTMVYDTTVGNGASKTYHIAGFAKWEVVGPEAIDLNECVECDGNSNYLKFIGYADEEGNLMPPGYTPW